MRHAVDVDIGAASIGVGQMGGEGRILHDGDSALFAGSAGDGVDMRCESGRCAARDAGVLCSLAGDRRARGVALAMIAVTKVFSAAATLAFGVAKGVDVRSRPRRRSTWPRRRFPALAAWRR